MRGGRCPRGRKRVGRVGHARQDECAAVSVIKAFLRRKCRTIYRRVREAGFMMLMNGDIHAMLIASAMIDPVNCYYDYSLSFITNS